MVQKTYQRAIVERIFEAGGVTLKSMSAFETAYEDAKNIEPEWEEYPEPHRKVVSKMLTAGLPLKKAKAAIAPDVTGSVGDYIARMQSAYFRHQARTALQTGNVTDIKVEAKK